MSAADWNLQEIHKSSVQRAQKEQESGSQHQGETGFLYANESQLELMPYVRDSAEQSSSDMSDEQEDEEVILYESSDDEEQRDRPHANLLLQRAHARLLSANHSVTSITQEWDGKTAASSDWWQDLDQTTMAMRLLQSYQIRCDDGAALFILYARSRFAFSSL